jgi:uncharacterized protein YdeI (YjbR/CyaY-like superfamily)
MPDQLEQLTVPDAAAWRAWLAEHHARPEGVLLVLAKKGTREPTSLSYEEALQEALCHGWIDGQIRRRDEATYFQRFTPRRRRSAWSRTNVRRVEQLIKQGRMRPAGLAQIEAAKADGRFDAAYAGQATIEVPEDLTVALAASPTAQETFEQLTSQNRYAILYRLTTIKRPETRARRIETYIGMLERGETLHPQSEPPH